MNSFAPGDYVAATLCIHNAFGAIHRGQLYRVAATVVSDHDCNCHAQFFPGAPCPRSGLALYGEPANVWCVSGFRPVYQPHASLFAQLMAPVLAGAELEELLLQAKRNPNQGFIR